MTSFNYDVDLETMTSCLDLVARHAPKLLAGSCGAVDCASLDDLKAEAKRRSFRESFGPRPPELIARCRDLRRKGWRQNQIARELGVSQAWVSMHLKGRPSRRQNLLRAA